MSRIKTLRSSTSRSPVQLESVEPLPDLQSRGISEVREVQNQVCGLQRFTFTTAVVVGITDRGYERRYCYEHQADARAALATWNGEGHLSGPWIKCKGAGIDLLNPEFLPIPWREEREPA